MLRIFARRKSGIVFILASLLAALSSTSVVALDQVVVKLAGEAAAKPITGRLFVFFTTAKSGEPRMGPDWFRPEPFFARDVANFAPNSTHLIDRTADAYPAPLDKLAPGKYRVQAVLHQDRDCQLPGAGVGNPYSEVKEVELDDETKSLKLSLTKVVEAPKFPETDWRKEVTHRSKLLSDFHKREVIERVAVVLPEGYDDEPERRYPVIYGIPGFGGSHRDALRIGKPPAADESGVKFIRVYLSGRCEWGHHVFADSLTNGPRGAALINETVPHIDETFRTIAAPTARFVTGHSSGGWSSLWLQVTYPDVFGGVWSLAPDPVDFRDFQRCDLYASPVQSLFVEESGERRPIARSGDKPVLWFDDFTRMDDVIGRGGQLRSFEAVFSPLDEKGLPHRMYDRQTGKVDPEVAAAWKPYDINLKLKRNWTTLEPKLRGKIHIVMGELDTFYLNGATELLGRTLKELKSDADVRMLPGEDHGSFLNAEFRKQMLRQMAEQLLKHHTVDKASAGKPK